VELTTVIMQLVGVLIGAGVGSFFGLKGAINGLRHDMQEVKKCAGEIETDVKILLDRTG
jgi:uncharacterized membrane protein YqgA involved in biofilm formation